jgi:hypothetical protein
MLRVQAVTGPARASAGERVTYTVTAFNEQAPSASATAGVSWLIKTPAGAALASISRRGPQLSLTIPDTWAGETAIVMPFMNSPSAQIAVRTAIAPAQAPPPRPGGLHDVRVAREGSRYYASIDDEPRFFLGTEVRYGSRRGLMNSANPPGPRYQPEEYEAAHGDWAWYLYPTITAESRGHFTCLNTYDRAAFTFGHIQLGAHTPNDNFVAFFREILAHDCAGDYFPDLTLQGGRICCRTDAGVSPIESATATNALMAYFNDTPDTVDDTEARRAALLVDWTMRHKPMRDAQVDFTIREQKRKLATHARKLPLDGVTDKLCFVVLDILHQGRGKYAVIRQGLAAGDPFDALLGIGASTYRDRVATLRSGIRMLEGGGKMGRKVYDAASGEFVVPSGA